MAVEPAECCIKKRKLRSSDGKKKLNVGEKVEVRSEEDGFLGSWHQGTVVASGRHYRHVKYDHLLSDDGKDNLVDVVFVSSIVDGSCYANASSCHNRGNIKPLSPPLEFGIYNLPYGLCVEVYYQEAWWEGVIFDHNDGSEERRIFFPDLGDEMTVGINMLRVTQDWDELTEIWHRRGTWLFLELIEEYERESPLVVSVKQIWYDLREKKGFKEVKDWTYSVRSLWEQLVSEVIEDNLKILVNHVLRILELPGSYKQGTQPLLEFGRPISDVTEYPSVELGDSHAIVPAENTGATDETNLAYDSIQLVKEKSDQEQLTSVSEGVGPNMNLLTESDRSCHDKRVCVLPQALMTLPCNLDGNSGMSNTNDSNGKGFSCTKTSSKGRGSSTGKRSSMSWIPAGPDIVSGAEFRPDAITEYAQMERKNPFTPVVMDVRKHLKHLKWEIECRMDDRGILRIRYISPDGKCYVSLRQVCVDLAESSFKILSTNSQDGQKGLHTESDDMHSPPPEQLEENMELVKEKSDQEQLISASEGVGPNMNLLTESNGSCHDKRVCVLPQPLMTLPCNLDVNSGISNINDSNGKGFSCTKTSSKGWRNSTGRRSSMSWIPAGPDIVPGAEFCPHAIAKYAQMERGNPVTPVVMDVRKHLKHLKWEIECRTDDRGTLRLRYISPDRKCYMSLRQVCVDLTESSLKILSTNSQDGQKGLHTETDNMHSPPPEQLEEIMDLDNCPRSVASSPSDLLIVKPKYNPQAVLDWYMHGLEKENLDRKEMILKARKHLSAAGWVFKYKMISRRLLCYYSPTGKCYGSLRLACKAYLDEGVGSETSDSRGKLSSALSNIEFHKSLVPANALSRVLLTEPSCISWSRKLKSKRKINSLHVRQRARSNSANLLKFKGGKTFKALTKLKDDMKGGQRTRVPRSRKRVKQLAVPSSSNQNPRTVLSWLIDNNVILPREKVIYCSRKKRRPKAEGRITRDGIKCNCCGKVYTLSGFEAHAGSSYCSPATHIFLKDGRTLLDCQVQVLNNMRNFKGEPHDRLKGNRHQGENDYLCSVCHYGGELILCDRCPSSFHRNCLGLEDLPDGEWFCPSCCCGICGCSKFRDVKNAIDENILNCHQCEHKYHVGCLQNRGVNTRSKENWFCSKKCEKIFLGLHKLLGKPIPIGVNNLTWRLVKSKQLESRELDASDIESLSKLDIALCVMHECFEPVNEPHTGRDLVEDVIFGRGSELNRLNFRGFYTVLLERNEELITVATVRVFGEKAAEVPLIGTRFQYRRLGMCRILMNELEKKLAELGIERLILPAIPSVLNTWTTSFGFSRMTDSERLHFVDYTFLDFPDTIMCQKLLLKRSSEGLKPSKGAQPKLLDDVCGSGDNIDLDGSSAVSEVSQAEHTEERGIVEQIPVDFAVENDVSGSEDPAHVVVEVQQPTHLECEPQQTKISPESSVVYADYEKKNRYSDNGAKCYKRRRTAASGSFVPLSQTK